MSTRNLRQADNAVSGRLALVTGSSGGIGSACARALAAEGCDVVLHYSSSEDKAETLATELRDKYPSQLFMTEQADLSNRDLTRSLVPNILNRPDIAGKHKAISILVANAGRGRRVREVSEVEEDDWDDVLEVNARSQFVVIKACLPEMRAQAWGRVVLIGSIAGHGGGINGCHYAASKGALRSMGFNLATLLAPEGVTVNIVSPAMIGDTGMIPAPKSQTWETQADIEALKKTDVGLAIATSVPVRRLGAPEEVSNVVTMLVKTGYLTGQDILLAGGLK